jgi:hypothetical protein
MPMKPRECALLNAKACGSKAKPPPARGGPEKWRFAVVDALLEAAPQGLAHGPPTLAFRGVAFSLLSPRR